MKKTLDRIIIFINFLYEKVNKNLSFSVTISITIIWVSTAIYILLVEKIGYQPSKINLDSTSSYLANSIAPLAIFWVIYSQIQQNKIIKHQIISYENDKHNDAQPYIKVKHLTIKKGIYEGYEEPIEVITIAFKIYRNSIYDFTFHPIKSKDFLARSSNIIPTIMTEETKTLDIPLVDESFTPLKIENYSSITGFLFEVPTSFVDENFCDIRTYLQVFRSNDKYWGNFKNTRKSIV